jgi:mono/diheme cytochrome c family protein
MANHSIQFFHFTFLQRKRREDFHMLGFFPYRWAGALVILLVILGSVGPAAGDELAAGKSLYSAKCQICHGANGKGDGPAAAALNPRPADFTNPAFWQNNAEEKIKRTVTSGKGAMPAFDLKDDEIKAVADYMVHTFKK